MEDKVKHLMCKLICICVILCQNIYATTSASPSFLTDVIVPVITPFSQPHNTNIDYESMKQHIALLAESKVSALYVLSSFGDATWLTLAEKKNVIEAAVQASKGLKPIIAGVSSTHCKGEVLELAIFAEKAGCSALVIDSPTFFICPESLPPSEFAEDGQEQSCIEFKKEIFKYFSDICCSVSIPVVIHTSHEYTSIEMINLLVYKHPNVLGIAYCHQEDDIFFQQRAMKLKEKCAIWCDEDDIIEDHINFCANGFVAKSANVIPGITTKLVEACKIGSTPQCELLVHTLREVHGIFEGLGGQKRGIKEILAAFYNIPMSTSSRKQKHTIRVSTEKRRECFESFERLKNSQ